MGEKFRKFILEQSNKEADEIMELVNQDPEMADVHAPDEMGEVLFARIAEYENEKMKQKEKLSEEEKELIELGKVYKKRRKVRKYVAAALVAILALSFGSITALGGPEKVLEVVEKWIAGGQETRINSKDERVAEVKSFSEEEAYERIQEEFGFDPVVMYYLPDGMEFVECGIFKEAQLINMIYKESENKFIICMMRPDYKVGSTGIDTEDTLLEDYTRVTSGISMSIKKYQIEDSREKRCYIEFEHENVYYLIRIMNVKESEVEKILDNIYVM